jgi:hypothetical protein
MTESELMGFPVRDVVEFPVPYKWNSSLTLSLISFNKEGLINKEHF